MTRGKCFRTWLQKNRDEEGKMWGHSWVHSDIPFHSHTYIFYGCMFSWCYCGKRNSFHHRKSPLTPVKILCLSAAIVDWRHKKNILYKPSSDKKKMEIHFGKIEKECQQTSRYKRVWFGLKLKDRKSWMEYRKGKRKVPSKPIAYSKKLPKKTQLSGFLSRIHTCCALYLFAIGLFLPSRSQRETQATAEHFLSSVNNHPWVLNTRAAERVVWGAIYHHPSRGRRPDFYCLCHTLTSRVYGGSDGGSHHLEIRAHRQACTVLSAKT